MDWLFQDVFWNHLYNKLMPWKDFALSKLSYEDLKSRISDYISGLWRFVWTTRQLRQFWNYSEKKDVYIVMMLHHSRWKAGKHCINSADFQPSSSVAKYLEPFSCQPSVMEARCSLSSRPLAAAGRWSGTRLPATFLFWNMCQTNQGQRFNYKQRAQRTSSINLDAHVFPLTPQRFFPKQWFQEGVTTGQREAQSPKLRRASH